METCKICNKEIEVKSGKIDICYDCYELSMGNDTLTGNLE